MDFESYFPKVDEAAAWLKERLPISPKVAVLLSGGLDDFEKGIKDRTIIRSSEIPHYPTGRAEGHGDKLVFGKYGNLPVVAVVGKCHYYEGFPPQKVVFPNFVLSKLGVEILIITNAVGGINKTFKPGDIMLVEDHINMMGINPLIGLAIQRKKDQFTSMIDAYDPALKKIARAAAKQERIVLKKGIFMGVSGPSYETKAEIKAFRKLGADTVSMSTIPEVISANFLGMKVLTFSCIANPAADLHKGAMSHSEVLRAMNSLAPKMVRLLNAVVSKIEKTWPKSFS